MKSWFLRCFFLLQSGSSFPQRGSLSLKEYRGPFFHYEVAIPEHERSNTHRQCYLAWRERRLSCGKGVENILESSIEAESLKWYIQYYNNKSLNAQTSFNSTFYERDNMQSTLLSSLMLHQTHLILNILPFSCDTVVCYPQRITVWNSGKVFSNLWTSSIKRNRNRLWKLCRNTQCTPQSHRQKSMQCSI